MMPLEHPLNVKARDRVTGLTGTITGHAVYLYGVMQYLIEPPAKSDGTLPEAKWIDVRRIELVEGAPQDEKTPLRPPPYID